MARGTYICPERVERDGYLVAFAGEEMTIDEAARRGLVSRDPEPDKPEPDKPKQRKRARKASV